MSEDVELRVKARLYTFRPYVISNVADLPISIMFRKPHLLMSYSHEFQIISMVTREVL